MEWLRAVDLAEYAPNLRGSGVHGGLIVSAVNSEPVFPRGTRPMCFETYIRCCYLLSTCFSIDPGASLQLGNFGPAVKYSSPEDFAPSSPGHCFLCPGWASGHAGEARVWECHRPRSLNYHGQSEGKITLEDFQSPSIQVAALNLNEFLLGWTVFSAKEVGLHPVQSPSEEKT